MYWHALPRQRPEQGPVQGIARDWKKLDRDTLIAELAVMDFSVIFASSSLDEAVASLREIISSTLDCLIPPRTYLTPNARTCLKQICRP